MPLYAGPPATPPVLPDVVVAWREDVGKPVSTWLDPEGVEWPLSDNSPDRGYFTTRAVAGWGATQYELVTDPQPRGGETIRFIRSQPARLTWPLHIWGDTHQQFTERYRALRRAFLMTVHRGLPGRLTVYRPDGSARWIEAYYEDGWTGQGGENWLSANPVVTLFCPDGAWADADETLIRRASGTPAHAFNPFLTLSAAQVLGSTAIDNPGELPAWPTWTIYGPCTTITASNNTTGQTFTLTSTLNEGETITIITGGTHPQVIGPAGQNLAGALNWPTAFLWGLAPGSNNITFTVGGSGAGTAIELRFYARYEGA